MNKKVLTSLVLIGVLTAGAAIGSYAWFTSKVSSFDNTIKTGRLVANIDINKNAEGQHYMLSGSLNKVAQPGDTLTVGANGQLGSATFEVVNSGDFDMAYLANFKLVNGNGALAEHIIITDWENGIYDSNDNMVWKDHFFAEGSDPYGMLNALDSNKDRKLSLAEWLSSTNNGMSVGVDSSNNGGWDVGGLQPGFKFKNTIKLVLDENAGDEFQGQSLNIRYDVFATQANANAVKKLMKDNGFINYNNAQGLFGGHLYNIDGRIASCTNPPSNPIIH